MSGASETDQDLAADSKQGHGPAMESSALKQQGSLLSASGSRWALRRFSHDSNISSTSVGSNVSAGSAKARGRRSDQGPGAGSISPSLERDLKGQGVAAGQQRTPAGAGLAGRVDPPNNMLMVKSQNPINIITDYGIVVPAPLTPSPSVKSPRTSPRGHASSLIDSAAVSSPQKAASPGSPPNCLAEPQTSPGRARKKLNLDMAVPTAAQPTSPGRKTTPPSGRSRRRHLSPTGGPSGEGTPAESKGSASPSDRVLNHIPGGMDPSGSQRSGSTPDTLKMDISDSSPPRKKKAKVEPDSKPAESPRDKSPARNKSPDSAPRTDSSAKAPCKSNSASSSSSSAVALVPQLVVASDPNSAGTVRVRRKIEVIKTYPSRIRQNRLSAGFEAPPVATPAAPTAAAGLTIPPIEERVSNGGTPSTEAKETNKPRKTQSGPGRVCKKTAGKASVPGKTSLPAKGVPGRKKKVDVKVIGAKATVRRGVKLKPTVRGAQEGGKQSSWTAKTAKVTKKVKAEPLSEKAGSAENSHLKSIEHSGSEENDKTKVKTILKSPSSQGGTSAKTSPKVSPPGTSSGSGTTKSSPCPRSKSPSIVSRKKSNLTLDVAKKLKQAAKKRVKLQSPPRTPKRRLSTVSPRSPRKSPRIILKDVIKLSKIEYDMAMTKEKSPSPQLKKTTSAAAAATAAAAGRGRGAPGGKSPTAATAATIIKAALGKQLQQKKNLTAAAQRKRPASAPAEGPKVKKMKPLAKTKAASSGKETAKKGVAQVRAKGQLTDAKARKVVKTTTKAKKPGSATTEKQKKRPVLRPISPDTSDDDVLYSLNPDYDGDDSDSGSSVGATAGGKNRGKKKGSSGGVAGGTGGEVVGLLAHKGDHSPPTFQGLSPRKMLLKDSIKPKTKVVKPVPRQANSPVSPVKAASASVIESSSYRSSATSPPRPPLSQNDAQRPDMYLGDLPTVPVLPLIPTSPSTASYKSLLKNLPHSLQPGRGGAGGARRGAAAAGSKASESGDDEETVERRVSVRQSESAFRYKEIIVKKCPGYTQIWLFTTTKTKNSLNPKVFQELSQAFYNAKFDDTRVVLMSGSGSIFCSGLDLNYLLSGDRRQSAQAMADALRDFVNVVIAFPKPIVAAVNGPAIGLGTAILPLFDIIYASDKASFFCPYGRLCQTPEACSSFTFPLVMGMAMANDMLLGGRKVTAIEAYQMGLVSQVFWPTSMMQEVIPRIRNMASQSIRSLEGSKLLIRSQQREKMELTNETECRMLVDRWSSLECQKAMRTYLNDELDYMI